MGATTRLHAVSPYSPGHFTLFRAILGAYLLWHFACLLPDAAELFGARGVLADPALNPTHGLFPNPLVWWGSPAFTMAFTAGLMVLATLLALGWRRRVVAVLLWFGWAALFNRNNLISNPGLPYVGLLLLMLAIVPDGEPGRWRGRHVPPREWFMPAMAFGGVWFLLAAGYTFSGLVKLGSPSWIDGTAFRHLVSNPLARPGPIRDAFLAMPAGVHALLTWTALAAEILFLPLCLWRRGRLIAWLVMVAMHLGLLTMVAFADLTLGMLMVHLFTFDRRWVPARRVAPGAQPLLLYDGECGLCNAVVRFLLREDPDAVLRFAPLQSAIGQAILRRLGLPAEEFDSLVFLPDAAGDVYSLRTDGVAAVLEHLGGVWRSVAVASRLVPAALRDLGYKLVARLRYALFGVYRPSPLPDPAWAERIVTGADSDRGARAVGVLR